MTGGVPGLGGTLLPERYLASRLLDDASAAGLTPVPDRTARQLSRWWAGAGETCGPTSALRTLFDRVAMPLCGMLGFTAHDAVFDGQTCRARLSTRRGTPVALLLTTWAVRPSSRWADLARHAHDIGAAWGFVLAPPFLSLVPTRGHATRHSLDATLPVAIGSMAVAHTFALMQAAAFDVMARPGPSSRSATIDHVLRLAARFQDDVRADLQRGVETSLRALEAVVDRPSVNRFDETLTLVYRILFLLFAESRRLVPNHDPIYRESYAMSRFCQDAARGPVPGLWDAFAATSRLSRMGCRTEDMRVSPFNGALFARASAPTLERRRRRSRRTDDARMRDEAVRETLVALGSRRGRAGLEAINYRDLGVEQLGAVYEHVLDLEPDLDTRSRAAARAHSPGRHSHLRKQTGTFYTPQPLAEFVVRRTLAPLTDGASSDAILALRVVDPAMGSGAFLVAACRYLAGAYEGALIAEGRLSPTDADDNDRAQMRRLIAEKCLFGVDRNATAVHLARLSLWLASLARDKPLSFLDHRLRTGDSLVGAWPGDLQRLSTRVALSPTDLPLFEAAGLEDTVNAAMQPLRSLLARHDDTVADVRAREADWRRFLAPSSPLQRWRTAAHLWCARWFYASTSTPPDASETRALLDAIVRHDRTLDSARVDRRVAEVAAIARDRAFFHWPLEFPDVFYDEDGRRRPQPGYDAVIGNPPWEMLRRDDGHQTGGQRDLLRYIRQSDQYPSCTGGHLNLYQAFVDRALTLTRPGGRLGLVLPWGLAADDGAARLRKRLLKDTALDTIVGLDNANGLFPIHRGLRFTVIAATAGRPTRQMQACFGVKTGAELDALPANGGASAYPARLTPEELQIATGPAMRFPDARHADDMSWLVGLSRRFPKLGDRDGWAASFGRELNATDARPYLAERGVQVIEGKHLSPFTVDVADARRIDAARLAYMIDPDRIAHPRLGYRDVSGVGNRLTLIAAVIPSGVVTTHTVLCLKTRLDTTRQHFLCALFNSYVLNRVVRMLMGGHVTTTLAEYLPVPSWQGDAVDRQIASLAKRLAEGSATPDTGARLQALVAHRYGLTLAELRYVLDGFPLVPAEERASVVKHFETTES